MVKLFFEAGMPMSWLVETCCAGCGAGLFFTDPHRCAWQHSPGGLAAVACSERCAAAVAAVLARRAGGGGNP
jgi:hypothetical protein